VFTNGDAHRLFGTPLDTPLHPAQLYDSLANLLTFLIVYRACARPHAAGRVMGLYLALSSVFRFLIEFFRFHEQGLPFGLALSVTQWISLALLALGLWLRFRPVPK